MKITKAILALFIPMIVFAFLGAHIGVFVASYQLTKDYIYDRQETTKSCKE